MEEVECKSHKEMSRKIDEIHDALLGTYDTKGLITKLEENTTFINMLKKGLWVIFGAIVTLFIKVFAWK